MTSIGETLHRERVRRGWSLEQIATETKIGLHLLQAMEANEFDRLPGGVFARNFARQYARVLGIDEEEIVAAFKQQFEAPAQPVPAPEPKHHTLRFVRLSQFKQLRERVRRDSSLCALVWLIVAALACATVYSFWQKSRRAVAASQTSAAWSKPAAKRPPTARPNSAVLNPAVTPNEGFRAAEISDNGAVRVPPMPVSPAPLAQSPAPVSPGAEKSVFPPSMRVAFTATEPVWVSIKSDGARAYTGTIEGEQPREFDASRKMTVLVGNAGCLKIALNGKPVGPIGPRGEVRLLVLTPQGAHVVPRTPPTPPPASEDSTVPERP